MAIFEYDYEYESRDVIIKLLAHKLEKVIAKRLYNKNQKRSKKLKMSLTDVTEAAQKEVQWMMDNNRIETEVEDETPLIIADDGRLN